MGYRSEIRVVTTFEGFKAMREIAFEIAKKNGIPSVILLFPAPGTEKEFYDYCATWGDCFCFGFDWIKWCDNYKYVSLFMDTLKVANERGINWQFVRVGGGSEDIENLSSDNFYDNNFAITIYPYGDDIGYCYHYFPNYYLQLQMAMVFSFTS